MKQLIPIAAPYIGQEEKNAVEKVLDSGFLAQGDVVEQFEQQFADFIGVKHAIATSNGTTALHLALLACDITEESEVITTSFSFIASSNAILFTRAKPVFVDIDPHTFNIDTIQIERAITPKTKAILPVHLFGLPVNMDQVTQIARKYNLLIIEDACQAHGAQFKGKKAGSFGKAGCFSFYPTKNMTTGEGGMITTNDDELADTVRLLRSHGMKVRYHHDILGFNFRMTNIAAAIGIEQLKKLDRFNQKRRTNAQFLIENIKNPKLILPNTDPDYHHVFHQFTIRVAKNRDQLIKLLQSANIGHSIFYPIPIHQQKVYQQLGYTTKLPQTEMAADQVISIPVHPLLKEEELHYITNTLNQF
jgi:perosamine synthetase